MAERGKPLSFALREQIKQQRQQAPIRAVAQKLHVSPNTVQKYSCKFDTKMGDHKK